MRIAAHPNKMAIEISQFREPLDEQRLFFFVGSGISFESGLPSAADVLTHTATCFLPEGPSFANLNRRLVGGVGAFTTRTILPEQFYEQILRVVRSEECLGLWRSLQRSHLAQTGNNVTPNINHRFVVEYSKAARLPIFTTNFDDMLEAAAIELGLRPVVILPGTATERDAVRLFHGDFPAQDSVFIFKLHGTVELEGRSSLETIHTTVRSISRVNFPVIDLVQHLSASRSLSFAGYSGRDIDLFPQLVQMAKGSAPYWIDKFEDRATRENSKWIGAERVETWPDIVFKALRPTLVRDHRRLNSKAKSHVLEELVRDVVRKVPISAAQRLLIAALALRAAGSNQQALRMLKVYEETLEKGLNADNYLTYLELRTDVLDGVGQYRECAVAAERLKGHAQAQLYGAKPASEVRALSALVAARHMRLMAAKQSLGPRIAYGQGPFFASPPWHRVLLCVLQYALEVGALGRLVRKHGVVTDPKLEGAVAQTSEQLDAVFRLNDMRIVVASFVVSLSQRPLLQKWLQARTLGYLARIANECRRVGDHFSLAGALKYIDRVRGVDRQFSLNTYGLFSNYLNQALVFRDAGESALNRGDMRSARAEFLESYKLALRSGSYPTALKALAGLAAAGSSSAPSPRRIERLARKVSGRGYETIFQRIAAHQRQRVGKQWGAPL